MASCASTRSAASMPMLGCNGSTAGRPKSCASSSRATSDRDARAAMGYQSVFKPGLFEGKVFLVTGGGSGIGRCTAHELTSLGATVVIAGRDTDKLETVQKEIAADGGDIHTHGCD